MSKENFTKVIIFLKEIFMKVFSIIKAFIRLCLLSVTFLLEGIDGILFSNREICGFDFYFKPQNCDEEKISYITKLNKQMGVNGPYEIEDIDFPEDIDGDELT